VPGDPWGPLLLQLALILVNGFFAATEIAVLSLNTTKLHHDAEEGDKIAEKLLRLSESPNGFLSTIQVCITLAGFLGSAFAADSFSVPLAQLTGLPERVCVVLVTLILSYFTLVFGELVPKRIAMVKADTFARVAIRVLDVCSALFKPVVWLLGKSTNGVLRICGIDPNAEQEEVTEDGIRMMVEMGGESGAIEETEKEMIENIFEFNNSTADEIMTHRTDVTSIWVGDDHETILKTIKESGLSRFPVYDEDMDDIVGTLNTRNYLLNAQSSNPKPLRELLHEAYFVPETVQADQLFRNMQTRKIHMAIVVDEYGGMSGIITMEDLLEQIVGNIYDEFDPQAEQEIVKLSDDTWRISGSASLRDINDALDIDLSEDEDYDTLGGLIFSQFTLIPQDGSTPELDCFGLHIQVEKLEDHRVESALVTVLPQEAPEEDEKARKAEEESHE